MKKTFNEQITLISPTDKSTVPFKLEYEEDDKHHTHSVITLTYKDVEYTGEGTDWLWVDTFADLQSKLPDNVELACCLTCRHGNMCPYGNKENQLFCTKNFDITSKMDMCDLFDKQIVYNENIEVFAYGYCDNFIYQSKDYYTYNDYIFRLEEK